MNLGMETETLEFKKSTGELKEAMNSICAMLNKHHYGELYFGVKPDGNVIGQIVTEESLREVSQKIKNFIEPRIYPEIHKVVLDGRDCIHVKFSGDQVPYFAYNVARIRVADEDLVMSREEITSLLLQSGREGNRWENLISNKMIDDVDEELLRKYIAQAHDAGRIAISYTDRKTVLNQLELTDGDRLLNAGKVLFSDDLIQDVQMATFATSERLTFTDIQRHHGPVLKLVDIAEDYIEHVERPVRRNPKIARILYYSKDIESFGTGLKRIADACGKAGVRYEFQKKKTGVVVCFYRQMSEGKADKSTDKVRVSTGKVRVNTMKFNDSQKMVIEFLQKNDRVTNKQIQELLGVKDSRALKILKDLVQKGTIVKKGKFKDSYYILKKED